MCAWRPTYTRVTRWCSLRCTLGAIRWMLWRHTMQSWPQPLCLIWTVYTIIIDIDIIPVSIRMDSPYLCAWHSFTTSTHDQHNNEILLNHAKNRAFTNWLLQRQPSDFTRRRPVLARVHGEVDPSPPAPTPQRQQRASDAQCQVRLECLILGTIVFQRQCAKFALPSADGDAVENVGFVSRNVQVDRPSVQRSCAARRQHPHEQSTPRDLL